jgi:hypothetical protein
MKHREIRNSQSSTIQTFLEYLDPPLDPDSRLPANLDEQVNLTFQSFIGLQLWLYNGPVLSQPFVKHGVRPKIPCESIRLNNKDTFSRARAVHNTFT